jgi:hypothetical protein
MNSTEVRRPPVPVVVAIALFDGSAFALFGLAAILPGATALGLWRGNRGARVVGIVIGLAVGSGSKNTMYPQLWPAYGPAVILLLVLPAPSRTSFARAREAASVPPRD